MTATLTRRVATLDEHGRGALVEEPVPDLEPGHVLVRLRATMISAGTQLAGVRELRAGAAPPLKDRRRLGYQAAGEVIDVGKSVRRLQPGQRVACFGSGALHTNLAVVPQNLCAVLPEGVSFDDASGMNLVLTAMHAIRRADAHLGEYLLVVGLGVVGQLAAQFARAAGLYVMGWDSLPHRRQIARKFSADAVADPSQDDLLPRCAAFTDDLGFDAAVMAIGGDGTQALEQVKRVMKVSPDGHAMGSLVMVGGLVTQSRWGAGMGNLDVRSAARTGPGYHDPAWERGETDYPPVFVRWTTQTSMRTALRMIADQRIRIAPLITHRFRLDDIEQAIDQLMREPDRTLGVVLTPTDE
ncbi:MAG TPA: zinc-binding dehydrogenase [Phycisphaeraceae bacterium]